MTELDSRTGGLGDEHHGAPISIDIEFSPRGKLNAPSEPRQLRKYRQTNRGSKTMDKDRIKGAAQKIKGSIEKAVGKAKDDVRDVVKDVTK